MKFLVKFWHDFKSQPDVWFFYGFLITFTLSVRKVLFFYPINGQFNEWAGIYLYLSDIFLMATLFLWGISILCNKNVNLSTPLETCTGHKIQPHKSSMFLPSRSKPQDMFLTGSIDNIYLWLKQAKIYLPLFLVVWSFISIFWSGNQNIALFKAIKLLELYLLYLYVISKFSPFVEGGVIASEHSNHGISKNPSPSLPFTKGESNKIVSCETVLKNVLYIVIILGFIQAIIGIWQFIIQHSIGIFWLKESFISPNIPGVAKIVLNGEKFIRAYGLFPHPNILGGFLLVSILLTLPLYKRGIKGDFYASSTSSSKNPSPSLPFTKGEGDNVSRLPRYFQLFHMEQLKILLGGTILRFVLVIQIIALILTFSKSTIIGLFIALLYILWKNKKMFHVKYLGKKVIIIVIILILSLYLAGLNLGENMEKSYGDRLSQIGIWKSITQDHLLLGVGAGNYMFHLPGWQAGVKHNYLSLETWQYQPVHNIFLLIWSELGFVGVFVFVWFLWKLCINSPFVKGGYKRDFYSSQGNKNPSPSLPFTKGEGRCSLWNISAIFKGVLLAFIFIMLFDHYLWDIQQGQIMLWLVLGLLAGIQNSENKLIKIDRSETN